jgi:hypothetical protein
LILDRLFRLETFPTRVLKLDPKMLVAKILVALRLVPLRLVAFILLNPVASAPSPNK